MDLSKERSCQTDGDRLIDLVAAEETVASRCCSFTLMKALTPVSWCILISKLRKRSICKNSVGQSGNCVVAVLKWLEAEQQGGFRE